MWSMLRAPEEEAEAEALKAKKDAIKSGNVLALMEQEKKAKDDKLKYEKDIGVA